MLTRNQAGIMPVEIIIFVVLFWGWIYMLFGSLDKEPERYKKRQAIADEAVKTTAATSPAAAYGINTYLSCTRSSGNNIPYCRDLTEVMAARKGGNEFARQALQGVDQYHALLVAKQ